MSTAQHNCLQAAQGRQPPFRDLNGSPRLHNGSQAIITSYIFQCCACITAWQTFVHPGGQINQNGVYDITFQVWRPSPTVENTGCYSLVGENRYSRVTYATLGLVSETPEPSNIISVMPGDVVGYYTYTRSNPQVVNGEGIQMDTLHSDDSVWYHTSSESDPLVMNADSIDDCPFPVGTSSNRVLRSSTNAAPVLLVSLCK